MQPSEWEAAADRAASELRAAVRTLEETFWPDPPGGSFHQFWARSRALAEMVRTAPAIKLDDKLALQRALGDLTHRANDDQRDRQREFARHKQDLDDALTLAAENLSEARTAASVQEVRADLTLLKNRVTHLPPGFPQEARSALWERWQTTNRAAWTALNAVWKENAAGLNATLDDAEAALGRTDSRAAKDAIRNFHAALVPEACSHREARALRERAHGLWTAADELARSKHDAYLRSLRGRMGAWRAARFRQEQRRHTLLAEIARLEEQIATATTDVAHALLRGQVDERRRALKEVDQKVAALEGRMAHARSALDAP